MKTLYDLLGALPDDDAHSLRVAFRKAVKATHPDINPGQSGAALRFRQIVRANAILSDPDQRAAYDRLLAAAERPVRTFVSDTLHKFATDIIAVVVLSAILVGGYALFWLSSKTDDIPAQAIEVTARQIKAATAAAADELTATGRDLLRDKLRTTGITSSAAIAASNTSGDRAIADAAPVKPAPNDAKSYRERGVFAYQYGDLARALANFDLAIQFDPGFAEAYVDRAIVLYRLRQPDRAFSDIAQAKRIWRQ